MFALWKLVIAPALDATDARRVVEIGALRVAGEYRDLYRDLLSRHRAYAPQSEPAL